MAVTNKIQQFGKVSDEELDALKKEHKSSYTLTVLFFDKELNQEVELYAYLKRPERYVMGMVLAKLETNPVLAKEMLLEKAWIKGDERIKTDDDAFYASFRALEVFFDANFSDIKKN